MSRILATAKKRFFATNIVVSLPGQFAASLPGGEHRRQHRPPESTHLERRDPRGRRPSGGGDHVLQLPRVLPGLPHHAGCSLHGGRGKPDRLLPPRAGANRPVGERLDEKERVRGAGSGERRDNVEQFLAGELRHLPEGGEDLPGPLLLFPRNSSGEEEAGAPHAHLGRGIRHRADHACAFPQSGEEHLGRHPRGDRDKELSLNVARPDLAERLPHTLRLDREDDRVALPGEVRHPPSPLARLPKMAVPTRIIVAPSSIAVSKSFDIPIESSVHPGPAPPRRASSSNSSRSRLKYGLLSSGSSVHGGMAISPRSRIPGMAGAASISAGNSPGVNPALVPSPAIFTSTRPGRTFPASPARRGGSKRSPRESTVWIHEKSATAFFTLFLWSFPIRCHSAEGNARIFSSASWT